MRGQVLDYSIKASTGIISAENGERFEFSASDWNGQSAPFRGQWIDFKDSNGKAIEIYSALSVSSEKVKGKSKPVLILLALFAGPVGAHKFYMGSWGWGIIYLFTFWWLFIPILATIVELVRYILMTDIEFEEKALNYKKSPFGSFW